MGSALRTFITVALLSIVLAACATTDRGGLSFSERVAADKEWYCGPGMFGIRAIARAILGFAGVPIPDACKLVDAIIEGAKEET